MTSLQRARKAVQVLSVAVTMALVIIALATGLYLGAGNAPPQSSTTPHINLPTTSTQSGSPSTVYVTSYQTTLQTVTSDGTTYTITATTAVIYTTIISTVVSSST
ncbi:MAG: hypothetical protein ACRECH_09400, partial [Nitrososphaerales archaeon]